MTYKVFLSYSWSNSAERRALVNEIKQIKSVEVLVDKLEIQPGDSIHTSISHMINRADCVVVLLTEEGLQSHEVLDEISRAHERGKLIVPVVSEKIRIESLPWYMRDINFIKYDERNFDQVVETVVQAVTRRANPFETSDLSIPRSIRKFNKPWRDVY